MRHKCSSFVAIDDLKFNTQQCNSMGDNTFEKGYEDYENFGELHWQIGKGTFGRVYAPMVDHTLRTPLGMYMTCTINTLAFH